MSTRVRDSGIGAKLRGIVSESVTPRRAVICGQCGKRRLCSCGSCG